MKSTKDKPSAINSISSKHYIVLLFLFIFGFTLVALSGFWDDKQLVHHILRDVGIAALPLSIIGFAYEIALRRQFLNEMTTNMRTNVYNAINESMPSSLKHLRDSGVVDAYERLDKHNLLMHIKNCDTNTEIRILDIWLENLPFLEPELLDAIINRNCRVTILLWDIEMQDVLERRANSLGITENGVGTLMFHIVQNLRTIKSMFEKLERCRDNELVDHLKVKIYSSFIGISLLGIGADYYLGFYLRERFSSDGTQLKISGYDRFFYHQIAKHFEQQWNDTTNKPYNKEDFEKYSNIHKRYIIADNELHTNRSV